MRWMPGRRPNTKRRHGPATYGQACNVKLANDGDGFACCAGALTIERHANDCDRNLHTEFSFRLLFVCCCLTAVQAQPYSLHAYAARLKFFVKLNADFA
jgi:hypothetical protein